jgi:hypothetical protein
MATALSLEVAPGAVGVALSRWPPSVDTPCQPGYHLNSL